MANTHLSLGLTRYAGRTFEKLHSPGCRVLTASSLPDVLGFGRHGRFSLAAHLIGVLPLDYNETEIMERGKDLQPVVARKFAREHGIVARNVHAWCKHPEIDLYCSPDMIVYPEGEPEQPGEVKVVAEMIYNQDWQDGPPERVLLQHQAQLKLTGAARGPIVALVIGEFSYRIKVWWVDAHPPTQKVIIDESRKFLKLIAANDLPPPDLTNAPDREILIKLARGDIGDPWIYQGPEIAEVEQLVAFYQRAGKMATRLKKKRDEAKARLIDSFQGRGAGLLGDRLIQLKEVVQPEKYTAAQVQKRLYVKDAAQYVKARATAPAIMQASDGLAFLPNGEYAGDR